MDLVYHTSGQRFFGCFQSLVHIHAGAGDKDGSTSYRITVYAYPENSVGRFFARHLLLVDRYFRQKTAFVTDPGVKTCRSLCRRVADGKDV